MKNNWPKVLLVILVLIGIVVFSGLYVVDETEQVVITQLGKPVGKPIKKAGIHLKLPFIQTANKFEKRILKWDGSPNQIPTKDKKYIWVDTTARWRIKDPLLFMERVGTIKTALSRLDGIIDSVVRDHVSDNLLIQLVRSEGWKEQEESLSTELLTIEKTATAKPMDEMTTKNLPGREMITRAMLADASKLVPKYGIELIDIRIKRINYVASVQRKVFDRMISERQRIAAQYRSEGEGEKAAILGKMRKELDRISSEAYKRSQEIKGKADAEVTKIYGDAFGKDPAFYSFFKTLEIYRKYPNKNTSIIITTDSDFYSFLKGETKK
ncbi:MAG: protease modulator HflC [Deltaproteobacteria bacterium]|nr:MAG: protease modulator HflC [Deltaproteobacteria bacterium]